MAAALQAPSEAGGPVETRVLTLALALARAQTRGLGVHSGPHRAAKCGCHSQS